MNQPPVEPPQPPSPQQPSPAQPQYGGQGPQGQRTNGMAVAALIAGILGVTICFGVGGIFALIFGYVARGQIKRSQGLEGGAGMAMAGIVLGWIGTIISIVLVVLTLAGVFALFGFAQSESFEDAFEEGVGFVADESLTEITESEAGCGPIEKHPNQGQEHIREGATFDYNSNPPTSGPHYEVPADTSFYPPESRIEPERLVHNHEHGQIVIWYRPGTGDLGILQDQVETLVEQQPLATVGAPYPEMDSGYNLVITAWTRSRACVNASQEVVDDFRRMFQGRAPERIAPRFEG